MKLYTKDPEGCRSLEDREQGDLGRLREREALRWALKIREDLCKWREEGRNSWKGQKNLPRAQRKKLKSGRL